MRVSNRKLGVYVPGLREFVHATWTIPENPFFPGMAGLRAFVPATFTLPPQPAGIGDFVNATFTLPPQPAGIGDFVGTGAMYPIPINSVLAGAASINQTGGLSITPSSVTAPFGNIDPGASSGVSGLSGCGGECGCGGSCGGHGLSGLGQASADFSTTFTNLTSGNWSGAWTSFMSFLQDPAFGTVPIWMIGGGVLLIYALFFSGGEHSKYSRAKKATTAARRAYA
jgi:hypothetical protein